MLANGHWCMLLRGVKLVVTLLILKVSQQFLPPNTPLGTRRSTANA